MVSSRRIPEMGTARGLGPNFGTTRPPLELKGQPYRQGGRKHAQTDDSHFEMKIAVHVGSLLRTDDRTVTESWALRGAGPRSRALICGRLIDLTQESNRLLHGRRANRR